MTPLTESGRRRLNRQRVDALLQLLGQYGIHHAVLFDAGLAAEGFRYDLHTEMAFTVGYQAQISIVPAGGQIILSAEMTIEGSH